MGLILPLMIVAAAIFVGISSKKFYDRPYIVNFGICTMMLLLVIQTFLMQPITTLGYVAIATCSIAFIIQLVLGIKNVKAKQQVQA